MRCRFCFVASFPDSVWRFRGDLINAILEHDIDVDVVAPGIDHEFQGRMHLEESGVGLHRVDLERSGVNPFHDFRLLHQLAAFFLRTKPNCVLAYTAKPVIYGLVAAWIAGVEKRYAMITGLGFAFTGRNGILTMIVRTLYRFSLSKAHKVFFQNPDDEALFRRSGILRSTATTAIVNGSGVNLRDFPVAPIPAGPCRFLMIGRLIGDKGVREYVQAARVIRREYPSAVFSLAGWIDENPDSISNGELQAWIDDGVVEFVGRLDDVRPEIARSTVYVLPSYREGTPRTVLEAMSMGRPVITTDTAGCRETVVDGYNGYLVPIKSAQTLVTAIRRFIVQPELIERMGARSRSLAEEKYDVDKVNARMLEEMDIAQGKTAA